MMTAQNLMVRSTPSSSLLGFSYFASPYIHFNTPAFGLRPYGSQYSIVFNIPLFISYVTVFPDYRVYDSQDSVGLNIPVSWVFMSFIETFVEVPDR
ncbi:hypothetical protein E2C01_059785 [Portunus trituberculatus]|uniref:Uncharacterized protein n=1 Tax=Portunus trituberculatus TaxID=210409 RepID=A0A5B7H8S4_PORTR|nr:hypothetical protein [Portunus trituberculatus]